MINNKRRKFMKSKNIIKGLALTAIVAGMASCSENYLSTEPQSELLVDDVIATPEGKTAAVFGLCQSMYQQYNELYDYRWFNGEPWLSMFYGEVVGQDYFSYFWTVSERNVVNWTRMQDNTSTASYVAWCYCYGLIQQANLICDATPVSKVDDAETAFRLAQARTIRAHAYTRLLQIYGPRWADSNNGAVECVVLRKVAADPSGDVNAKLAPMKDVLDFIYQDLDEALDLYESSGVGRFNEWEPDADIAAGIYARAALLKDDWATAQKMAAQARKNYDVSTADEYLAGFAEPVSDWMWCNSSASAGMYFASFGGSYACNGAYPCRWGSIGAGAINYELYKQMDENDIRRGLFFTPDKLSDPAMADKFWNGSYVSATNMNLNNWSQQGPNEIAMDLYRMSVKKYNEVGASKGWPWPYTNPGYGQTYPRGILVPFGAQFKFWATDFYGSSAFPFMRATEMLLIEAEAACHNGDETTAKNCLAELNENRIPGYTPTTKSGEALLDEVKLNRRIELWGEGFNWFDLKRWGANLERNAWVAGDVNSNNIPASQAFTYGPEKNNGWRWVLPRKETQYNTYIDQASL